MSWSSGHLLALWQCYSLSQTLVTLRTTSLPSQRLSTHWYSLCGSPFCKKKNQHKLQPLIFFFFSILLFESSRCNEKKKHFFYFRCDAGYTGQHCEKKDYSVLYVVPGPVRFQYVLIAAVIGTIQIAIICVVVLCITRSVSLVLYSRKRKDFCFSCNVRWLYRFLQWHCW